MSHVDPDREPVPTLAERPTASGPAAPSTTNKAYAGEPATPLLLAIALTAGVVAGLASWGVGEVTVQSFGPSYKLTPEQSRSIAAATHERFRRVQQATTQRATAAYGALGAALGLALGLAGGVARRSATMGLMAAVLGFALGGAAGAGATQGLLPIYFHAQMTSEDHLATNMTLPLLVHGGIWTTAGLAAGLALGLGLGGWGRAARAAIGGALGAVFGTFLYELAGAIAFPTAATSEPIAAERYARLLAHLGVAVFVALGAAWSARYLMPKRATSTKAA
jgi:hypothetical protein